MTTMRPLGPFGTQAPQAPLTTGEQATKVVTRVHDNIETSRRDLALLYANAEGGSVVEHAVGECLTKVRAALAQLRKAIGEVAQERLPLED